MTCLPRKVMLDPSPSTTMITTIWETFWRCRQRAQGRPVTLVCPLPTVASWMAYTLEQPRVLAELYEAGVTIVPNAVAQSYDGRVLELKHAESGRPMPSLVVSSLICVAGRAPACLI